MAKKGKKGCYVQEKGPKHQSLQGWSILLSPFNQKTTEVTLFWPNSSSTSKDRNAIDFVSCKFLKLCWHFVQKSLAKTFLRKVGNLHYSLNTQNVVDVSHFCVKQHAIIVYKCPAHIVYMCTKNALSMAESKVTLYLRTIWYRLKILVKACFMNHPVP